MKNVWERLRLPWSAVMMATLLVGALSPLARPEPATAARPPGGPTPAITKFTEALPVPPTVDLTGGGSVTLTETAGTHRFHAQLPPTPTWGYNGPYLGPTLEVKRGVGVDVTVQNRLGTAINNTVHPLADAIDLGIIGASSADRTEPRTATHLHGGHTKAASDGGPFDTFVPPARATIKDRCSTVPPASLTDPMASCFTYHYDNDQEATTLWYHDHAVGITRLNVMAGLAGFYLVRDQYDTGRPGNPLGLPAGAYEVPLVLQDRSFNPDGTLSYPSNPILGRPWVPEFFGDTAIINGSAYPNLNVDLGVYRFRVLNGSNARVYRFWLANKRTGSTMPFAQIGTDGGLLNAPVGLNSLTIAPGERADILVDFRSARPGDRIVMRNNAATPFPSGPRAAVRGGVPLPELMQFTVGTKPGFAGAVPAMLRGAMDRPQGLPTPAQLGSPVKVRNIMLNEILDPATGAPLEVLMNNQSFHDHMGRGARTSGIETPKAGTVEQWNIINTTADMHPIHLHLVQFRAVSRQKFDVARYIGAVNAALGVAPGAGLPGPAAAGRGPYPALSADPFTRGGAAAVAPNEMGWKDTIQANPGEITRILVQFGGGSNAPYATAPTGDYVFHCHILEHEENDMMQPYNVRP